MSNKEYYTLRRYAMKFVNNEDDQNDLVLLAWQESIRLGAKASMPILVNFMKLRGRENKRSIIGAKAGGKSIRDAWYQKPVSLSKPIEDGSTLMDFMTSSEYNPFGMTIVHELEEALTSDEQLVAGEIVAGYSEREAVDRLNIGHEHFRKLKQVVRNKALQHLA